LKAKGLSSLPTFTTTVLASMKIYTQSSDYNYTFPAVTLAYFLRYPNPYAKHVLSTDVIDRYLDSNGRLVSLRLHNKKSKVPSGILKLLPKGMAGPGGASQSYVLEKSIVDIREGWMETESRNMEWTGILSVVEHQSYRRQPIPMESWVDKPVASDVDTHDTKDKSWTSCKTTVTFVSRLGHAVKASRAKKADSSTSQIEEEAPKQGFFASWSTSGIQKTIEMLGMKRTKTALVNGRTGMNVVLERLRSGGIVGVLEGMRKDRAEAFGPEGPWKQVWLNGNHGAEQERPRKDFDID
jgi:4-amino-4-deoxychorismate lyase